MSKGGKKRGVSPLPATGLIKGAEIRTSDKERKVEITDEILSNFEWWGKMNYSREQMCSRLGVSLRVMTQYLHDDCRIKQAIERGKNDVFDMLVKSAYRDAQKDGKLALQILKAKYGWTPTTTQHMVIEQETVAPIPAKLSDDPLEASRIYQKLMG